MRRGRLVGTAIGLAVAIALGGAYALRPAEVSPAAIRASVEQSPELLDSAWGLPAASSYGQSLTWQANGSFCGPASIANVFRSIGEEETSEAEVLEGTGWCRLGFCWIGLTLDELAEVARAKTERKVTVLRDLTPDEFQRHLRASNDPSKRYIVNFSREAIFGAGVGHHSPIGGYLEAEDLVFVLDVNERFKPWLVPREKLYSAVDTLDGDHKRGLLLIE
ncbi:phytochelatin synthase family protein [Sinorhizobium fredii]|uniref:glutathione gamma-glutamylcysteinyltransferase n=1 Tax=Rhizobium fredii TaxID=380 RepID=A0A2A6M396_RHIFR|nr:phytochelatin synthase family protein [Sinorhizobium fredii]ASY69194.1 hypothetical protein SF83666_c17770 [Sinorhizobium fredii CCBAU 83666]PDT49333.1 phytochelatin synthase [Sinorhizobium fredii]